MKVGECSCVTLKGLWRTVHYSVVYLMSSSILLDPEGYSVCNFYKLFYILLRWLKTIKKIKTFYIKLFLQTITNTIVHFQNIKEFT